MAPSAQVAPVFTLMENELFQKMGRLLGGKFATNHDGLFVPGGSLSTIYSLLLARYSATLRWCLHSWAGGAIAGHMGVSGEWGVMGGGGKARSNGLDNIAHHILTILLNRTDVQADLYFGHLPRLLVGVR